MDNEIKNGQFNLNFSASDQTSTMTPEQTIPQSADTICLTAFRNNSSKSFLINQLNNSGILKVKV